MFGNIFKYVSSPIRTMLPLLFYFARVTPYIPALFFSRYENIILSRRRLIFLHRHLTPPFTYHKIILRVIDEFKNHYYWNKTECNFERCRQCENNISFQLNMFRCLTTEICFCYFHTTWRLDWGY